MEVVQTNNLLGIAGSEIYKITDAQNRRIRSYIATASMVSPVYYDANDTNYYTDPSDQSRMKYLNLGTSPTSGISSGYIAQFRGSLKMTANNIDYVSQLHFNDNVRFYDDGNVVT